MKAQVWILILAGLIFAFLAFVILADYKQKGSECGSGLVACLNECSGKSWWEETSCIVFCSFRNTGCLFSSLKSGSE